MSMFLQSLWGYGTAVDPEANDAYNNQQALHMLSHMAMPVPRSWWEMILERLAGRPSHELGEERERAWAGVLRDVLVELHKLPERFAEVDRALLIALSFSDIPMRFGKPTAVQGDAAKIEHLLAKARETLKQRPELATLARECERLAPNET